MCEFQFFTVQKMVHIRGTDQRRVGDPAYNQYSITVGPVPDRARFSQVPDRARVGPERWAASPNEGNHFTTFFFFIENSPIMRAVTTSPAG